MFDISTIICGFGAGAYVLSKCYIGGITTNIEKSKRVPIPSGTISMCFQDAILDFYHPL